MFAGIGGTVDRNTDLSASKPWISKTDGSNKFTLNIGTVANPIPDVATSGTNDFYTIELKMVNSASKTTTLDL